MVIYTRYEFHEIPFIAYKVMAENGKIIEIWAVKGQLLHYNL